MLAANHSGGRLLGRPSIGAMFKSRAAAMYPYIRQQWVGLSRSARPGAAIHELHTGLPIMNGRCQC